MNRFSDIDPNDIDPDTGRPYASYSSPSLDMSFHDHEMSIDDEPAGRILKKIKAGDQFELRGHVYIATSDADPYTTPNGTRMVYIEAKRPNPQMPSGFELADILERI